MPTKPFEFGPEFRIDRCDLCGRCFVECPVLEMPDAEAQASIRALIDGNASRVLRECTGCMACNTICPHDANPHSLILERWNARYHKEGIPARGALVLPYQRPNLYTMMTARLPADEQRLVDQWRENWRNPPKADTMMYAGCNFLLLPFLLEAKFLEGVPIFGAPELCCGEPLYRMGCLEAVQTVAERLRDEFARMGFKRLIMPCLAGYHLFRHVYPEVFGVAFDFEIVSAVDWIFDRVDRGELRLEPLNKTAVLHDSCWPKASGDHFFDRTRELLGRAGVTVVEPKHARAEALCCGMCAAAARFRLRDVVRTAKRRLREFEAEKSDIVIDDCGGCTWLLSLVNLFPGTKVARPMYHLLEVIQMSLGEPLKHRTDERTAAVAKAMFGPLAKSYARTSRFRVESIGGRPVRKNAVKEQKP